MLDVQFIREGERDYPGIIKRVTPRFLEEAAIIVQGTAKRLVHSPGVKGHGNLKGSISRDSARKVFDDYAEVGTNVEYAEYLEYGTKYIQPGWPFMRPAIDENRKKLIRRLAELVKVEIMKRG